MSNLPPLIVFAEKTTTKALNVLISKLKILPPSHAQTYVSSFCDQQLSVFLCVDDLMQNLTHSMIWVWFGTCSWMLPAGFHPGIT